MLDIKFLRENPEVVKQNIRNKFQDRKLPMVDEVIALDQENRDIKQEVEALRAERNKQSKEIGKLMGQGKREEAEEIKKQIAEKADRMNELSEKEKEVEELRKFASEKIITKLLDGLDNLERAISASEATKDFDGLVKGVDMILGQLKGIMENEGVEPIKAEGKYDPMYHHAVMVEDNPEFEDDTIILELQKGYTMKGKVIRPAMVKVCKRG